MVDRRTHPAWYHNLKANPKVAVELGTETFRVVAKELDDEDALLGVADDRGGVAGGWTSSRGGPLRTIPVFMLTRED